MTAHTQICQCLLQVTSAFSHCFLLLHFHLHYFVFPSGIPVCYYINCSGFSAFVFCLRSYIKIPFHNIKAEEPPYTSFKVFFFFTRVPFDGTSQNKVLCLSIFSHLSNLRPINSTEFLFTCSLPKTNSMQIFLFLLDFSEKVDYIHLMELKCRHLVVLTKLKHWVSCIKRIYSSKSVW